MKARALSHRVLLVCGSIALGGALSVVACAGTEEEAAPSPDSGDNQVPVQEGGRTEPDAGWDVDAREFERPKCSEAGWCRTTLPDEDLALKDVWPVGARAFAIAESPTLGVRILEWSDAGEAWRYIDDGTQNEPGLGTYAGRIWAPSESEVYFGVGPGYVYHGESPVAPATVWTWTRHALKDNSHVGLVEPLDGYPNYWATNARYPAIGVWGTGKDDVYAWFTNTIYHWTSVDGGPPEWVAEYIANDAAVSTEHLFFLSAAGRERDGIWFSGARSRTRAACALLVRKTAEGYRRIADGTLTSVSSRCTARAGSLLLGGAEGWLVDLQATSADQVIGLKGARDALKIAATGDGYSVAPAPVPVTVTHRPLTSLWVGPESSWLTAWGLVARTDEDVWDGGTFEVSPLSAKGTTISGPIYQVRGTSNTSLWAVGVRNALHKTTP